MRYFIVILTLIALAHVSLGQPPTRPRVYSTPEGNVISGPVSLQNEAYFSPGATGFRILGGNTLWLDGVSNILYRATQGSGSWLDLVAGDVSWDNVIDKPETFAPEAHEHSHEAITNAPWLSTNAPDGTSIVYSNGVLSAIADAATVETDATIDGVGTVADPLSVSQTIQDGATAGATALQPDGDGSGLSGITAAQVGASPTGHAHTIDDVTGLQGELDGKQDAGDYVTETDPAYLAAITNLTEGAGISITGTGRTWEVASTITQYNDTDAVSAIKADADWKATDWDAAFGWGDWNIWRTNAPANQTNAIVNGELVNIGPTIQKADAALTDAASDGKLYGRKDGAWSEVEDGWVSTAESDLNMSGHSVTSATDFVTTGGASLTDTWATAAGSVQQINEGTGIDVSGSAGPTSTVSIDSATMTTINGALQDGDTATAAERVQVDTNSWLTIVDNEATFYRVEQGTGDPDTNVVVITGASTYYNGPAVGTEFDRFDSVSWYNEDVGFYVTFSSSIWSLVDGPPDADEWRLTVQDSFVLPKTLTPFDGDAEGTVTIDYKRLTTNAYTLATTSADSTPYAITHDGTATVSRVNGNSQSIAGTNVFHLAIEPGDAATASIIYLAIEHAGAMSTYQTNNVTWSTAPTATNGMFSIVLESDMWRTNWFGSVEERP